MKIAWSEKFHQFFIDLKFPLHFRLTLGTLAQRRYCIDQFITFHIGEVRGYQASATTIFDQFALQQESWP